MIEFEYLGAFILLPLPLLIARFAPGFLTSQPSIRAPFFSKLVQALDVETGKGSRELKATPSQKVIVITGWVLLVLAAAKPVWLGEPQQKELSGRDLMMVVDLSGSMAAQDFSNQAGLEISRLEAAKQVMSDFSSKREADRLGLILFGDSAFLQSPFTADHDAWLALLYESQVAMAGESTHLGDAIGLGIKTFSAREPTAQEVNPTDSVIANKQKVMVVLTDGNDTDSLVPPIDAAKVAASLGIRVHMVAMGNPNTTGEQAIDMGVIEQVARLTGGKAFLAMSPEDLEHIYQEIDALEPSVFESFSFQPKESLHHIPVVILLLSHIVFMSVSTLRNFIYRRKNHRRNKPTHASAELNTHLDRVSMVEVTPGKSGKV